MNQLIECMLTRRSIRRFRPEQIMEDALQEILQAGLYAPNAGSRQSAIIVVCQNAEVNEALGRINKAAFHGRLSTPTAYISKEQPSIADDATIQSAFYGAPTVLTLFAPKNFLYSAIDCAVAAQNMMLAAHALGIGSCMIGRAEDTFASELGQQMQREWGINESMEAKVHLALGYADRSSATAKPRRENRIMRVV